MFARPRSFSVLYGLQRSFMTVFYLVSVVTLFWVIFYLLHEVLQAKGTLIIPVSLVYLVLIVLGYSIIQVIGYIPSNLAGAFDPLKNGIADGSISTGAELAGKLADFLCSFFNFTFFDIEYALVRLSGMNPVPSSNLDLSRTDVEIPKLEEFAASLDQTSLYGRVNTESGACYLYAVPLVFGKKRLGYMAVATRKRLWRIFIRLLNEFENDFVDDQVVHVLARETTAIS